jgi:transposase-like protein
MARSKTIVSTEQIKALLEQDGDFLRPLVQSAVQEALEVEITEQLGAERYERTDDRVSYRSGYYRRHLVTRVGRIELRVPQDRQGHFSTDLFERYQRSEKALVMALVESYVQGVSTRKVKRITEQLCGQQFSASSVSRMAKKLDRQLQAFAGRALTEEFPCLVLDARYEKVRAEGVVRNRAVLVAIGIDWEGRRQVLGIELANRESTGTWEEFLCGLKRRGLHGVEFVVSDNHEGLKRAVAKLLPDAWWQRCYVHFLRNAADHMPRKADSDCLTELRWLYDRWNLQEAREDLMRWLSKWQGRYAKLCDWVEENIEETFTFYRLPRQHHKHMKSTNMLERFNQEIKRRTQVLRIFPNEQSCLRLIRALGAEKHEDWIESHRYLDMALLREQRKQRLETALLPETTPGTEAQIGSESAGLRPAVSAVTTS